LQSLRCKFGGAENGEGRIDYQKRGGEQLSGRNRARALNPIGLVLVFVCNGSEAGRPLQYT